MRETDPSRVVLGADVLAAAVSGADEADSVARATVDLVVESATVTLVASDALVDAAAALAADRGGDAAASEVRRLVDEARLEVTHPTEDHPALATAYQANAAHLVTRDPDLLGADAAAALRPLRVSIRTPDAFLRVFDPDALPDSRTVDGR